MGIKGFGEEATGITPYNNQRPEPLTTPPHVVWRATEAACNRG
jgi:hypothetical protein